MSKRIAILGENSVEFIDKILDTWNAGDCVVLPDWRTPKARVVEMLEDAGVTRCHIDQSIPDIETIPKTDIQFLPYSSSSIQKLPEQIAQKYQRNTTGDEAVILFSSGTTGRSKGIILTHYAIENNAGGIRGYMNLDEADRILIIKTLCHSSTLTGELLVALQSGAQIHLTPTISPPRYLLEYMETHGITQLCLNPTLLKLLIDQLKRETISLQTLKTIYVSGSILNEDLQKQAQELLNDTPIYNVYGLTEAAPRVCAQRMGHARPGSVGAPIDGVTVRISDTEGTMSLSAGERGEIWVKTPYLFSGYVSGDTVANPAMDGWLRPRDIGFLDEAGELHVLGRADDMILHGAHNVVPYDVERVIREFDEVLDCAVFGVADELLGERIVCIYTGLSDEDLAQSIYEHCMKHLLPYEIPTECIRIDIIPISPTGKRSTRLMREKYMEWKEAVEHGGEYQHAGQ